MEIKFLKLEMVNFKGTRNRVIEFSKNVTLIQGRNKVGKTTVADACWWVLFGKDSQGNTNFGIKTNGADMKPIPKIDHIVTLTMLVDGSEITLQRQYVEDWTKRRGGDEELTGHHMVSCINGSRVKESEYKEYIESLCNESLFKVLSKSEVFFTLKPDAQRALLVKMVGEKTPEQFVNEHPEFADVLKSMGVLDFDTYLNGIGYKMKEIDKMISDTDSRIKEQNTELIEMSEMYDFDTIRMKIAECDAKIRNLQEELSNPTEAEKVKAEKIAELTARYNEVLAERDALQREICDEVAKSNAKHTEDVARAMVRAAESKANVDTYVSKKKSDVIGDVDTLEKEIAQIERDTLEMVRAKNQVRNNDISAKAKEIENQRWIIENCSGSVKAFEKEEAYLEEKVADFKIKWNDNENLRDDISTICPTCHQPLPHSRIAELQAEADKRYEETRAKLLKDAEIIKANQAENKEMIANAKEREAKAMADLEAMEYDLEQLRKVDVISYDVMLKNNERYQSLQSRLSIKKGMLQASEVAMERDEELENLRKVAENDAEQYMKLYHENLPTVEEKVRESEKYADLSNKMAKVKAERDSISMESGNTDTIRRIKEDIKGVTETRDAKIKLLGMEDVVDGKKKRIEELRAKYNQLQEQKATLQGEKELARDYQMAIIEDMESRVNALFDGIKFRMFDQKLNGNVEPCCKCYIGVTEYKDGSHAERINAGLEMIDTMAKYNDKFVPCFVDDAEGINQVYETRAQQIRLIVTMEDEMQVIHM